MKTKITYHAKDVLFKSLSEVYKDQALTSYGLDFPKIVRMLPNEFPQVKVDEKKADSVFLLEDDSVLLLEYESNNRIKENFIKYGEYIIRIINRYYRESREIKTVNMAVIYASDIVEAENKISFGSLSIGVQSVFMKNFDGELALRNIHDKIKSGEELTNEEIIRLILLPLMKSKKKRQEIIEESMDLAKNIKDGKKQLAVIAGLLTVTDKFIDEEYAKNIREWLRMTKVEKIYEEEKQKLIEEKEKEKQKLLKEKEKEKTLKIAKNLLDVLVPEQIAKKTGLTLDEVLKLKNL